jgi:hypothetical protein
VSPHLADRLHALRCSHHRRSDGELLDRLAAAASIADQCRAIRAQAQEVADVVRAANQAHAEAGLDWLPPIQMDSPQIRALRAPEVISA